MRESHQQAGLSEKSWAFGPYLADRQRQISAARWARKAGSINLILSLQPRPSLFCADGLKTAHVTALFHHGSYLSIDPWEFQVHRSYIRNTDGASDGEKSPAAESGGYPPSRPDIPYELLLQTM